MERDPRLEAIEVQRRHPIHGVIEIPTQSTIVWVTIATRDGGAWAADLHVQQVLYQVWSEATSWRVGHYLLMPTHLHYFAAPGNSDVSLEQWSKYWKRLFTQQHGNREHRWQIDHWDTRIRSGEQYREKWEYVRQNPMEAKLVMDCDDWLYQGTVFDIQWYQTK